MECYHVSLTSGTHLISANDSLVCRKGMLRRRCAVSHRLNGMQREQIKRYVLTITGVSARGSKGGGFTLRVGRQPAKRCSREQAGLTSSLRHGY